MIRVLDLHGDPFSMGRQHGEQVADLRQHIVTAMQARLAASHLKAVDTSGYRRAAERVWEEYAPATLEMMRGISQTLALDWDDYFLYTIASFLTDHIGYLRHNEGCTTWAADGSVTRDGAPILVKNRDYRREHQPLQCLARMQPAAGLAYLCLSSAGSPGVFSSGINSAGLAVADTHVVSVDTGPGIARFSWMMDLLSNFSTVEEARASLGTSPHFGDGTVTAADASGDLAVFEIAHSAQASILPSEGFVVSTNHFTAPETSTLWVDTNPAPLQGNSAERRRQVENALRVARGKVDSAWSQALMAQHGSALDSICRHPRDDMPTETISCTLFFPRQASLLVANGPPCQSSFELFHVAS